MGYSLLSLAMEVTMDQQPTLSLRDEDMETVGPGRAAARVGDADERDAGPIRDDADEQDVDGTDQSDDADTTDS